MREAAALENVSKALHLSKIVLVRPPLFYLPFLLKVIEVVEEFGDDSRTRDYAIVAKEAGRMISFIFEAGFKFLSHSSFDVIDRCMLGMPQLIDG